MSITRQCHAHRAEAVASCRNPAHLFGALKPLREMGSNLYFFTIGHALNHWRMLRQIIWLRFGAKLKPDYQCLNYRPMGAQPWQLYTKRLQAIGG